MFPTMVKYRFQLQTMLDTQNLPSWQNYTFTFLPPGASRRCQQHCRSSNAAPGPCAQPITQTRPETPQTDRSPRPSHERPPV